MTKTMNIPKLAPRKNPKGTLKGLEADIRHLWNLAHWLQDEYMSGRYSGDPLKVGYTLPRHCGAVRSINLHAHALCRVIRRLQGSRGE